MWCDSHCHVPWDGLGFGAPRGGPPDILIAEARAAGVTRLVTVGTDAAQSKAALALAEANDGVWATVGLHPHEASAGVETVEPLVAGQPKLVAIGECGLDYHYDF